MHNEKLTLPNPQLPILLEWDNAVPAKFYQQAQRVPNNIAVIDHQVSWTYAELEERTHLLANYLLKNNICPSDTIAIHAHRSADLVWAILGVLKAGAAFIILDHNYPTSRLIDYLKIAQPIGFLEVNIGRELPLQLSEYLNNMSLKCRLVLPQNTINNLRNIFLEYGDSNSEEIKPDDLAYVAFTSGSTGKPKGILGTHRPLSHFLKWHCQTFNLQESDRFSMVSGLAHDPLLRDIFTPLCLGATLCIPQPEDIQQPGKLAEWMSRQKITICHLTPPLSQLLTVSHQTNQYLRYLFFGGDVLKVTDIQKIRNFAPLVTCVNFYGATETPQAMGYFVVPENLDDIQGNIPVGKGIDDVQLLVLNQQKELTKIGEQGEIYVRTPYLTKGYIGSENLTQEKYLTNPFTNITADRLYKTGDLGRYLRDGNIELLGRSDDQVKIRGFRIEPGEIEAILNKYPGMDKVLVLAKEDITGNKKLISYLICHPQPTIQQLREFLSQELPDYKIPAGFVFLKSFPLTPNGKIDRHALPEPEYHRDIDNLVVASDQLERELITIWEKYLQVKPIGVTDDFFELGGHSLIAVRIFLEIEQKYSKKLPLSTLFAMRTISDLAKIIREKTSEIWSSLVLIREGGKEPPLFCIHPIGGNILEYYPLGKYLNSDRPIYGIQSIGLDGQKAPLITVEEMASHYIQEIHTIQPQGPYFLLGYSFGGLISLEMARQLKNQGEKVVFLGLLDTYSPTFQAVNPPLFIKIWVHIKNFWLLTPSQKIKYIIDRVKYNWDNWQTKLHNHQPQSNYKDNLVKQAFPDMKYISPHYFQVLEANFQASINYQGKHYDDKLILFLCQVKSYRNYASLDLGWKDLVKEVEVCYIPGEHYQIFREPNIKAISQKIQSYLDNVMLIKYEDT